jgi:hypothetical protein
MWTNAVHDNKVVDDIMKRTSTVNDVHRYKKVLIKPEAMSQVQAARIALRAHWWQQTLPWGNSGVRILPSEKYQEFTTKMRELQLNYNTAVDAFVREYPKMKAEARRRLMSLYDENDFPSMDSIKRKFGCDIDYSPIPSGEDFRVDLSESEKKILSKEVERAVEANARGAMNALVQKMVDTIQLLSERMKESDPGIRKSLVENIKKVCDEVSTFNFVDDKRIEAFKKSAEALTTGIDLDQLKEDKKAREALATKADDILAKMAAYTGGGA